MTTHDPPDKLTVLVIDEDASRAATVCEFLTQTGHHAETGAATAGALLRAISDSNPDVVLIDMASPNRDLLESLSFVSANAPKPIVLFSQEDDPAYIRKAVDVGVSTYLVGDLDPAKVQPVIDVALAQFRAMDSLRTALQETRTELDERRLIDQAKARIMETQGLSEQEAFALLRRQAMTHNLKLVELAQKILGLLPLKEPSS